MHHRKVKFGRFDLEIQRGPETGEVLRDSSMQSPPASKRRVDKWCCRPHAGRKGSTTRSTGPPLHHLHLWPKMHPWQALLLLNSFAMLSTIERTSFESDLSRTTVAEVFSFLRAEIVDALVRSRQKIGGRLCRRNALHQTQAQHCRLWWKMDTRSGHVEGGQTWKNGRQRETDDQ